MGIGVNLQRVREHDPDEEEDLEYNSHIPSQVLRDDLTRLFAVGKVPCDTEAAEYDSHEAHRDMEEDRVFGPVLCHAAFDWNNLNNIEKKTYKINPKNTGYSNV